MLGEVPPEPVSGTPPSDDPESTKPSPKARTWNKVIRGLKAAQKYSAIGFTAFAGLHLTSTIVLPALVSVDAGNSAFMAARTLYQSSLGEPLWVFGSLLVHIASGLILHARRVYIAKTRHGRWIFGLTPTITSGLILSVFATAHIYATRLAPMMALGDSSLINLDFITWALKDNVWVTGTSMILMSVFYFDHALRGIDYWYRLGIKYYRNAIVGVMVGLTALSLARIRAAPDITGWIASQYQLAH